MKTETKKQKYTLEEACAEIIRIKKEAGMLEYQKKSEQIAFANGYAKACNDIQEQMAKQISLLSQINVFNF